MANSNKYLGVWLGEGGKDREEAQVLGADRECAEPARLRPATSALIAPPPATFKNIYVLNTICCIFLKISR